MIDFLSLFLDFRSDRYQVQYDTCNVDAELPDDGATMVVPIALQ